MVDMDINQLFIEEDAQSKGYLAELEPWSQEKAENAAAREGIDLSDEHWDVIQFLRERYRERGQPRAARSVVEELEEHYSEKGGRRYLYTLFPNGPVTQGSRIAGLPLPPYATDPSFGSSE